MNKDKNDNATQDWNTLIPLMLNNHIQLYVHSKDHYTIDDGDVNGFCKIAVHKSDVKRVLADCIYLILNSK